MTEIHPMAYVHPRAELADGVSVGPFCHVGEQVSLGAGCRLIGHCTVLGPTRIGPGNVFYPGCVIGAAPQDLKYKGGPTELRIGRENQFREMVTVHRGTEVDAGMTVIGDHNLFMIGVHLAHDVTVENNVILANNVLIAGHCHIESRVNIGGGAAAHHFATIGRYAYVGGMTRMTADIAPYMKTLGYEPAVRAVNSEGMRRWGLEPSIGPMKEAFRLIYGKRGDSSPGRTAGGLAEIEQSELWADEHVRYLANFLRRQLAGGHFGRHREGRRKDRPEDRKSFYASGAERST